MEYKLYRVAKEVESLSPEEIVWGQIMLVDPRDYKIHEKNIRTDDPDRGIEALEDSILEVGFRFPCISNGNKEIVDGGRRWRIAKKHSLKFPVIHIRYSEDINEANIEIIFDSIIGNMGVPNTPKEVGKAINYLVDNLGITISEIAKKLGKTNKVVLGLAATVVAPKELLPEENPDIVKTWENLTPHERKTFETIIRASDLPPAERIEQFKSYVEVPFSEKDSIAKDIVAGTVVDIKERLKTVSGKYMHFESNIGTPLGQQHMADLRARAWDRVRAYRTFMRHLHFLPSQWTQKMYREWGGDEIEESE